MCLLTVAFFLKNMSVVIYAKILYHSFVPTIYENFKWFFFTYLVKTKIGKYWIPVWFKQLKELKKFWGTFTE